MSRANFLYIVVVGLAAFAFSLAWYSPLLFGGVWQSHSNASISSSANWKFVLMPLREIVTAFTVAFLIYQLPSMSWRNASLLAAVLWFGFYVVQLAGAVLWDNRPWQLSAVHAGDWLVKLQIITISLSLLLRQPASQ